MPEPVQPWAKEPWSTYTHQWDCAAGQSVRVEILDSDGKVVLPWPGQKGPEVDRIIACVNACAGVPTECLERVEQGKSSVIVADEVLSGQRAHFVMPDSTKT